jgi:hypothetical protein
MKNESETNMKKEKLVIVMRHGERSDLAGADVKLSNSDPELTEIGKSQAYAAGKRLKEIIEELYSDNQDKMVSKKIAIISSPFSRTLETAKYAKNGFGLNAPIYIENGLSEFISKGWFKSSPKHFLCYYSLLGGFRGIKEDHKNKIDKPEYFFNEMMNEVLLEQSLVDLPEYPESTNFCISRFHKTLDLLVYYYLIRKDYDIILLVTHVFGLQALCEKMEIPMDYFEIEYCSTFIFKYDQETGKYNFEKNFYPILY